MDNLLWPVGQKDLFLKEFSNGYLLDVIVVGHEGAVVFVESENTQTPTNVHPLLPVPVETCPKDMPASPSTFAVLIAAAGIISLVVFSVLWHGSPR